MISPFTMPTKVSVHRSMPLPYFIYTVYCLWKLLSWIQLKLCSIDVKQPSFCHVRTDDECWYCELDLRGIDFVSLLVYFRYIMELFQQYFFVCLFTELVYPVRTEVVSWQDVSPPVSYCIDEICFSFALHVVQAFWIKVELIGLHALYMYRICFLCEQILLFIMNYKLQIQTSSSRTQ